MSSKRYREEFKAEAAAFESSVVACREMPAWPTSGALLDSSLRKSQAQ